jgi:acylphosphatase
MRRKSLTEGILAAIFLRALVFFDDAFVFFAGFFVLVLPRFTFFFLALLEPLDLRFAFVMPVSISQEVIMPNYIGRRFVLRGRVQGVGCRAQVQELVEGIGHLSGHVQNLADGSVEVCLKGPDWRMADIERIFRSQMLSPVQIQEVEAQDMPIDYAPTGFVIRR